LMGDRLGTEFGIISVTLDPSVDTPEKLREWASRFGARPGWTFVTGAEKDIVQVLTQLIGQVNLVKDLHAAFVVVGDERQGTWQQVEGQVEPQEIFELMQGLRAGKQL
jgi:protein SCO1